MEGGFNFGFGGDPEEIMRNLREFAERQSEAVQESQREHFATLTLNTAVELAAAAMRQVRVDGSAEEQALALRDAMRILFPEGGGGALVLRPRRQGFRMARLGGGAPSFPGRRAALLETFEPAAVHREERPQQHGDERADDEPEGETLGEDVVRPPVEHAADEDHREREERGRPRGPGERRDGEKHTGRRGGRAEDDASTSRRTRGAQFMA